MTACEDKTARLWDAATGVLIGQPLRHDELVLSASFSPDGKQVVTASADKIARLWDAATGAARIGKPLQHDEGVYSASFSPDSKLVVTTSRGQDRSGKGGTCGDRGADRQTLAAQ